MTAREFKDSAAGAREALPEGLGGALQALWLDAHGNWNEAHDAAQDDSSREGAWVHAYLHRKEGDGENASYWYSRAGRPVAQGTPDEEWEAIATELLR